MPMYFIPMDHIVFLYHNISFSSVRLNRSDKCLKRSCIDFHPYWPRMSVLFDL